MKKITHLQKYVIDSLIKNNELSLSNFIEATSIICSKEQFDNIITQLEILLYYDISAGESKTVYICGIVGYKRVKSL